MFSSKLVLIVHFLCTSCLSSSLWRTCWSSPGVANPRHACLQWHAKALYVARTVEARNISQLMHFFYITSAIAKFTKQIFLFRSVGLTNIFPSFHAVLLEEHIDTTFFIISGILEGGWLKQSGTFKIIYISSGTWSFVGWPPLF